MDFKSEISKLEKQVTDLKAAAHDQQNVVAQIQSYLHEEQNRLGQIEINLKVAETTLNYVRQLREEEENGPPPGCQVSEQGKKESGEQEAEANASTGIGTGET